MKTFIVLLALLILSTECGAAPAPYTEDALNKLVTASKKVGQPVVPGGISKEEGLKVFVDWVRKVYSKAGFSFDATVIQLSNNLEKNSRFLASPSMAITPALFTYSQVMIFVGIEQQTGIKIDPYFSKKTADAMRNISAIIKRQDEANKQEGARKYQQQKEQGKQAVVNAIPGNYTHGGGGRSTSVGEERSAIDIKLSDDKKDIVFSGNSYKITGMHTNKEDPFKTDLDKEDLCLFKNKTAHLSYAGQFGVYELFEATFEEGDCKMLMKFFGNEFGNSLEIEQANKCSAYCKKDGSMGEKYHK